MSALQKSLLCKRGREPAEKNTLQKLSQLCTKQLNESQRASYTNDTSGFYMTDFMFVFNVLLLGNSGFASENRNHRIMLILCICTFLLQVLHLGLKTAEGLSSPAQSEELTREKE